MPSSPTSLQWFSLVGAIWLQTINGANSDFPVYSSQLKQLLSISQIQLNNLAVASDAGKLLGWISGVAAVHLPLWLVLMIGAVLGLIGYGVQFLFLINKISLSYWDVFALSLLAGNGICWINTVCYVVSIKNFPSHPRVAVGLSTSYVGLSAKVYTVLSDAIFHPVSDRKASAYLLLNAIAPVAVATVTAPFVRVIGTETDGPKTGTETGTETGFMVMFVITLLTGLLAVVCSMGCVSKELPSAVHIVFMGLLLVAPLVVPLASRYREGLREKLYKTRKERRVHDLTVDEIEGGLEGEKGKEVGINEGVEVRMVRAVEEQEEVGVGLMVRRVEFWLYFFGYMFGATVGLVFLNNLGQIVDSRGLSRTSSLVSLSSSFGFFGRFMPFLLDYFLSKYMVSRAAFMATLMAPMAGAFFLLLEPSNLSLCISTAIIGASTGAITSVAVSATPELFGTKNFSVNHNVIVANIPIGSFIFGYLAAFLYQREDGGGGSHVGSGRCMGTKCYSITFTLWGCICSVGTLLFVILHMRTRSWKSRLETTNKFYNPSTTVANPHTLTVR